MYKKINVLKKSFGLFKNETQVLTVNKIVLSWLHSKSTKSSSLWLFYWQWKWFYLIVNVAY